MNVLKLYYGPYELHGLVKHRSQKLYGLYNKLISLGYEVEVIKVDLINALRIEMCHRIIFRSDIRHLMFNMDYEDDLVCQRVIGVVEEAFSRMNIYNVIVKSRDQITNSGGVPSVRHIFFKGQTSDTASDVKWNAKKEDVKAETIYDAELDQTTTSEINDCISYLADVDDY